jgi:DeoR/GlpR family transcriptional regulator of sugar metabolism
MEMLIAGMVIGVCLCLAVLLGFFKVQTRESWEERELTMTALRSAVEKKIAENARLRVALAAGEMTEDAKKVATLTMAALDAVITDHDATECFLRRRCR